MEPVHPQGPPIPSPYQTSLVDDYVLPYQALTQPVLNSALRTEGSLRSPSASVFKKNGVSKVRRSEMP